MEGKELQPHHEMSAPLDPIPVGGARGGGKQSPDYGEGEDNDNPHVLLPQPEVVVEKHSVATQHDPVTYADWFYKSVRPLTVPQPLPPVNVRRNNKRSSASLPHRRSPRGGPEGMPDLQPSDETVVVSTSVLAHLAGGPFAEVHAENDFTPDRALPSGRTSQVELTGMPMDATAAEGLQMSEDEFSSSASSRASGGPESASTSTSDVDSSEVDDGDVPATDAVPHRALDGDAVSLNSSSTSDFGTVETCEHADPDQLATRLAHGAPLAVDSSITEPPPLCPIETAENTDTAPEAVNPLPVPIGAARRSPSLGANSTTSVPGSGPHGQPTQSGGNQTQGFVGSAQGSAQHALVCAPSLAMELDAFVNRKLQLRNEELRDRHRYVQLVERVVQNVLGRRACVTIHGSLSTGLSLQSSDIDILVSHYEPIQPLVAIEKVGTALYQLDSYEIPDLSMNIPSPAFETPPSQSQSHASGSAGALNATDPAGSFPSEAAATAGEQTPATTPTTSATPTHTHPALPSRPGHGIFDHSLSLPRQGLILTVQTIVATRVPVVKVSEKLTGLRCDVSFGGGEHFPSMELTNKLLHEHRTARFLLLFMKFCVKKMRIGESEPGGITSFPLYLLAMHFYHHGLMSVARFREAPFSPAKPSSSQQRSVSPNVTPVANTDAGKQERCDIESALGSAFASNGGSAAKCGDATGGNASAEPNHVVSTITSYLFDASSSAAPAGQSVGGSASTLGNPSEPNTAAPEGARQGGPRGLSQLSAQELEARMPFGQVLLDFCIYYAYLFDYDNNGIHFQPDGSGVSQIVDKPLPCRYRDQHLHLSSPFDERYDVTARMAHTREFQLMCIGLVNVLSCGNLSNLLEWMSPETLADDMAEVLHHCYGGGAHHHHHAGGASQHHHHPHGHGGGPHHLLHHSHHHHSQGSSANHSSSAQHHPPYSSGGSTTTNSVATHHASMGMGTHGYPSRQAVPHHHHSSSTSHHHMHPSVQAHHRHHYSHSHNHTPQPQPQTQQATSASAAAQSSNTSSNPPTSSNSMQVQVGRNGRPSGGTPTHHIPPPPSGGGGHAPTAEQGGSEPLSTRSPQLLYGTAAYTNPFPRSATPTTTPSSASAGGPQPPQYGASPDTHPLLPSAHDSAGPAVPVPVSAGMSAAVSTGTMTLPPQAPPLVPPPISVGGFAGSSVSGMAGVGVAPLVASHAVMTGLGNPNPNPAVMTAGNGHHGGLSMMHMQQAPHRMPFSAAAMPFASGVRPEYAMPFAASYVSVVAGSHPAPFGVNPAMRRQPQPSPGPSGHAAGAGGPLPGMHGGHGGVTAPVTSTPSSAGTVAAAPAATATTSSTSSTGTQGTQGSSVNNNNTASTAALTGGGATTSSTAIATAATSSESHNVHSEAIAVPATGATTVATSSSGVATHSGSSSLQRGLSPSTTSTVPPSTAARSTTPQAAGSAGSTAVPSTAPTAPKKAKSKQTAGSISAPGSASTAAPAAAPAATKVPKAPVSGAGPADAPLPRKKQAQQRLAAAAAVDNGGAADGVKSEKATASHHGSRSRHSHPPSGEKGSQQSLKETQPSASSEADPKVAAVASPAQLYVPPFKKRQAELLQQQQQQIDK